MLRGKSAKRGDHRRRLAGRKPTVPDLAPIDAQFRRTPKDIRQMTFNTKQRTSPPWPWPWRR